MDTLEIVYYTCLNDDCPKHRSVFMEGDPQHEGCAHERLWLEGQRPSSRAPRLLWRIVPVASAAICAAVFTVLRVMRPKKPKRRAVRDEIPMKTWSGSHAHRDDKEGKPVPPPIT